MTRWPDGPITSVHQHAAVHLHSLTQDVAGGGGGKKENYVGDFIRFSGAALGIFATIFAISSGGL